MPQRQQPSANQKTVSKKKHKKRPKKNLVIENFQPDGILLGSRGPRRYTEEAIDAIIAALPEKWPLGRFRATFPRWWSPGERFAKLTRREVLVGKLEMAAQIYDRDAAWSGAPSSAELKKRLVSIQDQAEVLLHFLGLGPRTRSSSQLVPYILISRLKVYARSVRTGTRPMSIEDAIAGVKLIHDTAERIERSLNNKSNTEFVHQGNRPFNDLIRTLAKIWEETSGLPPRVSFISGTSKNAGSPCGPYFSFVQACVSPLPIPSDTKSPKALGSRLRQVGRIAKRPAKKR